ncbi:39S ribosomal protein L15, mitochondrial [Cyclospora cayetanensis]|uniref:39S ribosomal protein L15, mitochondrial n=1 Tax=Cyclospora cayetanensis TaxID=88456 RepID=A0A6P6S176_9EIME|nr:39S ribosomal protein L15, mitochondrial [Cyclospora cayetanensis]
MAISWMPSNAEDLFACFLPPSFTLSKTCYPFTPHGVLQGSPEDKNQQAPRFASPLLRPWNGSSPQICPPGDFGPEWHTGAEGHIPLVAFSDFLASFARRKRGGAPVEEATRTLALPRSRRTAIQRKPLLPIEPRNLRQPGLRKKKRRRGRGDKSSAKGIRLKRDQQGRFKGPRSKTFEGGKTPLYRRLPKWPEAWLGRQRKRWEPLNLAKIRQFLEQGRLDARFPITQRHLHDSRCVRVRNGVHLFNVNDYPFPYRISIEVASADQSAIDAVRRVGGEVRVVYRHPINLRAHIKPYKFDVLPKTARPGLEAVHFLEKLRARGCVVSYIKPQWMELEERRMQRELQELWAEAEVAAGKLPSLHGEPSASLSGGRSNPTPRNASQRIAGWARLQRTRL